jgi:hypothetical protein
MKITCAYMHAYIHKKHLCTVTLYVIRDSLGVLAVRHKHAHLELQRPFR